MLVLNNPNILDLFPPPPIYAPPSLPKNTNHCGQTNRQGNCLSPPVNMLTLGPQNNFAFKRSGRGRERCAKSMHRCRFSKKCLKGCPGKYRKGCPERLPEKNDSRHDFHIVPDTFSRNRKIGRVLGHGYYKLRTVLKVDASQHTC